MIRIIIIIFFILFTLKCIGQSLEFDYLGLSGPKDEIELFAPDIISLKNSKEMSIAISPNGDEVFFSGGQGWPESKIMHVRKINNEWSKPKVADFSTGCYSTEPAFSPDGKYLYYSSSKGMKDIKQYCIWRVEKAGNEWGEPEKVIDTANPEIWEFHPSITKDGTVYFCYWDSLKQIGNIYKSKHLDGVHLEPERVDFPFNTQSSDVNPFIDPDEEYIIISSTGQDGKGGYDVYISYRKKDDSWSAPINFGDKFNTIGDDDSFDVSPDGRFLFIYKQDDVYWTETKGVFESLKKDSLSGIIVVGQNKDDIKMEQRLTFITLGVKNLNASIDFYENKFGWKRSEMSNDDMILFQLNGIHIALYPREELAKDATVTSDGSGFRGFTISYNAKSEQEVDDLIEGLSNKGVRIVKEPQKVFWGGYSSYVADPDENLWEIVYNPYLNND